MPCSRPHRRRCEACVPAGPGFGCSTRNRTISERRRVPGYVPCRRDALNRFAASMSTLRPSFLPDRLRRQVDPVRSAEDARQPVRRGMLGRSRQGIGESWSNTTPPSNSTTSSLFRGSATDTGSLGSVVAGHTCRRRAHATAPRAQFARGPMLDESSTGPPGDAITMSAVVASSPCVGDDARRSRRRRHRVNRSRSRLRWRSRTCCHRHRACRQGRHTRPRAGPPSAPTLKALSMSSPDPA